MPKDTERGHELPDSGGVLGGLPHPLEKEIRRKETPGAVRQSGAHGGSTPI